MNRVRTKKVKGSDFDMGELNEMFNQMLGTSNINLEYAWPRFQRIRKHSSRIVEIIRQIATSKLVEAYYPQDGQDLDAFCDAASAHIAGLCEVTLNLTSVTAEEHKAFSEVYYNMQRSQLIEYVAKLCSQLRQYEKHILAGSCAFILKIPGLEWYPIPFSKINFKALYSAPGVGATTIAWITNTFRDLYAEVKQLCIELQTPNIDISKFSEIIIGSLERIQKEPQLSRCGAAFKKIRESVDLLKGNFGQYYSDFVSTTADGSAGNGFIIMEHFIADVSKSTPSSPKLKREFAVIVKYFYKAFEKQRAVNPQLNNDAATAAFSRFSSIFSALDVDGDDDELHIDTVSEEDEPPTPEMASRIRAATMSVDDLVAEIEGKPQAPKKTRTKK
jgi:hypothetical protein